MEPLGSPRAMDSPVCGSTTVAVKADADVKVNVQTCGTAVLGSVGAAERTGLLPLAVSTMNSWIWR